MVTLIDNTQQASLYAFTKMEFKKHQPMSFVLDQLHRERKPKTLQNIEDKINELYMSRKITRAQRLNCLRQVGLN